MITSCLPSSDSASLKGLWQGIGEATYSIHVWEEGELVLEDTWEGAFELTLDVTSALPGNVVGDWYWRDLSEGTQFADPSDPLPFSGTVEDGVLSIQTTEEQDLPVATLYEATFDFDISGGSLDGGGTYSEDGASPDVRILFEATIEEITLSHQ